jgi:hypothetical protein
MIFQRRSDFLRAVLVDIACRLAFVALIIIVASVVRPLSLMRALGAGSIELVAKAGRRAKKKATEVTLPRPFFFSKARKA